MNSRERVRNMLTGRPYDRIPNGLGCSETSSMHVLAYEKMQEILGIKTDTRILSFMFNAAQEREFMDRADVDILLLGSNLASVPLHIDREKYWKKVGLWGKDISVPRRYEFEDVNGDMIWKNFNWKCPKGSLYFDAPLSEPIDPDEFDPDGYHPIDDFPQEWLRLMEEQAKCLYEGTRFSLSCGEVLTDLQYGPGGMTDTMVYIALYPDRMRQMLSRAVEASLRQIKLLDQAIGKYVDFVCIAHDLGDTRGVTMGENNFRSIYLPYYKKWFDGWKKLTDMKISMHSCGAIANILPDLCNSGLDILNPVQTSAAGMIPARLKERFGDKLIFFGGAYDAVSNVGKTYEEVYTNVKNNITELSSGGGYIFAGVHNIPGDVPAEHLQAMLNAYNDLKNNKELVL